ncbi:hypothetical protein E2C01_069935 [Portunus trituberculatus]|uniref:Uncharacterized protein n=1 Tax=Portunus trituberculatus TaxID=210409 RepID=A0A5B7I0A4_PORTR|nr:hypothetical protein [Portunus trituberculatus]
MTHLIPNSALNSQAYHRSLWTHSASQLALPSTQSQQALLDSVPDRPPVCLTKPSFFLDSVSVQASQLDLVSERVKGLCFALVYRDSSLS